MGLSEERSFAYAYDAYANIADNPEDLGRVVDLPRQEYRRTGKVPPWAGLHLLRAWLFYLQRVDHWNDGTTAGDAEWRAVLREIRSRQQTSDLASPPTGATGREPESPTQPDTSPPDVLLVTCVKSKGQEPAAARDLYTSALFKKQRAYAEALGVPWFILSAKHGLVTPDEWIAPYEMYLPQTSPGYRRAWGERVVSRLEEVVGDLAGLALEIHASHPYTKELLPRLQDEGAVVRIRLAGLSQGQRLAWYGSQASRAAPRWSAPAPEPDRVVAQLTDQLRGWAPERLEASGIDLRQPGLYSWWVDPDGASELSRGLGLTVEPGLIYAGSAGATRWPSGKRSSNTLRARLLGMHLGGKHEFSTFRRTLGSILAARWTAEAIDEDALTQWMHAHLKVIPLPVPDADSLAELERQVLDRIDPPLNLMGRPKTPVRRRLTELRRPHAG